MNQNSLFSGSPRLYNSHIKNVLPLYRSVILFPLLLQEKQNKSSQMVLTILGRYERKEEKKGVELLR